MGEAMTGGYDEEVEALAQLGAVLRRVEPAPASVLNAARAAFNWRTVAVAIAGLEFDSAVDDDEDLARVRAAGSERRLRFRGPGQLLEIALVDGNKRLAGRVDPPSGGSMVLRRPDGEAMTAPVNDAGQFFFDHIGRGVISLKSLPGRIGLLGFETEWVTI